MANGGKITDTTEGPIIWPTTATYNSNTVSYSVVNHCFFSTQLSSNLLAPIPLVDKGYAFYLTPWGGSVTLTSPNGYNINLVRKGNEWHLPPLPHELTPQASLATYTVAELSLKH